MTGTGLQMHRRISRDEFHHVLTRILMIPCTSMEAGQMFAAYSKADADNLTLEEFVHQSMPPVLSRRPERESF